MNENWRDLVLQQVASAIARTRVVADPDGLLLDEDLLRELDHRGFSVLLYDDPWMFRVRYEEDYRQWWDNGQTTANLLVRSTTMNLDAIPYDIMEQSDPVYLSVSQLFSHLDRSIMAEIDPRLFDRAFPVDHAAGPGRLTRGETLLRILRAFYAVDPELVNSREDVWALITKIYQSDYALSASLVEFLAERLSPWQSELTFSLPEALMSRGLWERILRQAAQGGDMMFGARYWLNQLGWDTEIGIQTVQLSPNMNRKLTDFLNQDHIVGGDWLSHAKDIAALRLAAHLGQNTAGDEMLQALDHRFEDWVYRDYGLLQSLSPYPDPTMVHQVVHFMAHQKDVVKWALILIDGMSYPDWLYIKALTDLSSYQVTERAVFAWVPTITSVSRKAVFSGRIPREFGQPLDTTSGEELLWRQFWMRQQRCPAMIRFHKTADLTDPKEVLASVEGDSVEIVGLVANMVDLLAHSSKMGMQQFLSDLKMWIEEKNKWLLTVVTGLVERGFQVIITSDHGHTAVEGIGKPPTGDVPDSKGRRVQVFSSEELRQGVSAEWGQPWAHLSGLPAGYVPLLAPAGKAYAPKGHRMISHGGVSMEELIVPMIRVTS
ncbi:MAG: BREX-3 system phosphatase PglZ [Sulfobacillus sp.]